LRLPLPTPEPRATLRFVREELTGQQAPRALTEALARPRARDVRGELEAITGALFDTLARNRRRVKLADRAALDWPELAALWFEGARHGLVTLLARYFEDRIRRRRMRAVPDVDVAARLVIETCVFWAVHRHWDARPQDVTDATARATAVQFVVNALAKE
jgi:hypothetical protein